MNQLLDFYENYRILIFLSLGAILYFLWPKKPEGNSKSPENEVIIKESRSNLIRPSEIRPSQGSDIAASEPDESLDDQEEKTLSLPPSDFKTQKVLDLEKDRISKGYKHGWLYYSCLEKGLLHEYFALLKEKRISKAPSEPRINKMPGQTPVKLTIELVPQTCWFSNLRSVLKGDQWKKIKTSAYQQAANLCEICKGRGSKWPVEAHEMWSYDDANRIQKLERIIALCPSCHEVKHMGLATVNGRAEIAGNHLMKVNNWSQTEANDYIKLQFDIWEERSAVQWRTDLSLLQKYGYSVQQIDEYQLKAAKERGNKKFFL